MSARSVTFCLLLSVFPLTFGLFPFPVKQTQQMCKQTCAANLTFYNEAGSELFCDKDCSVQQCIEGCMLYPAALHTSCNKVCLSSYQKNRRVTDQGRPSLDEFRNCVQGCNFALDVHAFSIKEEDLGDLDIPILDKSSLSSSALTLEWNTPILEDVTYKLHKCVVAMETDWHLHDEVRFRNISRIEVWNLHPYVTYKFKVIVQLSSMPEHMLESPETVEIRTYPHGAPSTAPLITSATSPSPMVIYVAWTPPPFTNGEILGYRIYLVSSAHTGLNWTTTEVPSSATYWLLRQMEPSQQYFISVSAWNSEGEGPKSNITVRTLAPDKSSFDETQYIIFGSANKIIKRSIQDIVQHGPQFSESVREHQDQNIRSRESATEVVCELPDGNVKGISLHVRRQLILATDSSGSVTLISLADSRIIWKRYSNINDPGAVSVDWLADRAFIAGGEKIYSCSLDTDLCVVVVKGLSASISDVKVDPINGFLYYVVNGDGQGLYRVDLGSISYLWTSPKLPQPASPPPPKLILGINDLMTLVVDFYNLQLYAVGSKARKIMMPFLDGSSMKPFLGKTDNLAFSQVSSMVLHNQSFIWTDKRKVYIEQYKSETKTFQHKELQLSTPPYMDMEVFHSTAQPMPIPLGPPEAIEALFTSTHVTISWKPPALLQYQGSGARRNWTYELQLLKTSESGELLGSQTQYHVSGLNLTVNSLDPDNVYNIKIRARLEMSYGPWSGSFIGRTLKQDGLRLIVGIAGGQIIEKDLGQGMEKNIIKLSSDAIGIDSHDDIILLATKSGSLSVYNQTSKQQQVETTHKAHCVAYDWLGHKIYWSELDPQAIYRSDISGNISEHILQSPARDIAVDAVNGRMYWATLFSVETSHLNGDNHQEILSLPLITGRRVVSLTIDFQSKKVLWCEKDYNSQALFMTDLIAINNVGGLQGQRVQKGEFKSISSSSSLKFFSHHLFWLTEQNSLVVGDSQGSYTSNVSFHAPLTSFTVSHPSLHPYPSNISVSNVKVIPNSIQPEDISTKGRWSNFNLTWPQSTEVTYGTVFYKVFVEVGKDSKQFTTTKHFFEMSGYPPYTQMVVYIQPYTYWGYAAPTAVSVRTPMSKPTAVVSPKVSIIQHKNVTALQQSPAADFRWMTPQMTNGIISHYLVTYWFGDDPILEKTVTRLAGTTHHFVLSPLLRLKTYSFKVAACTEAGCSPDSDTKTVATKALNPVPALLVAAKKSIIMSETEKGLNSTFIKSDTTPKAVNFLAQDKHRVFWLDARNKIYENFGSSTQELIVLNGTGLDLTIDWISRTLYVVESDGLNHSRIMQYNIDTREYKMFLSRSAYIGSIVADPYNSVIIWAEMTSGDQGHIMSADIVSSEVHLVIGKNDSYSEKSSCSCPLRVNVAPVIAMDYKDHDGVTEIIFADKDTSAVYSTDISGCHCTRIAQPTPSNKLGLPPSLLAVDHKTVSWYNQTEGRLYSVSKTTGEVLVVREIDDVKDILAYGSHLQPLPDSECLDPGAYNASVEVIHVGNTSIHLQLSTPVRPPACHGISVPQDKYTVYYKKVKALKTSAVPEDCSVDLSACDKQTFYTTTVEAENLEPYTQYLFQVAVSNYYMEYLSEELSDPLLLSTKFGTPQAARNLKVSPLTPTRIAVTWQPPLKFNVPAEQIIYVIQFSAVTDMGHIQKEMISTAATESLQKVYLENLKPGHLYNIRVQTCTANRTICNATDTVKCKTFLTPGDISFVNVTSHAVEILWKSPPDDSIVRHHIRYAKVMPGQLEWFAGISMPGITENNTEYREAITELKPNTLYAFRIYSYYRGFPIAKTHYIWPPDETRFTHRTLVFHPDQPSSPTVNHLVSGDYEVQWKEPCDNGAPITNYILEYRNVEQGNWKPVYNGSEKRWLIETSRLKQGDSYIFRVAAINSEGMGAFSDNSSLFVAPFAMETNFGTHITIGVVVGLIALVIIITLAVVYVLHKRQEKTKLQQFIIHGPDTELATLRELPHTTFQQSNTLYAVNVQCTDEEIALLPHFSRNQLVLTMFLGSGAFGEVFEGMAKNILGDGSGETKCAVKTLRKSASDQEKEEFLKEALLMKNFKHEHILSLLGVCLDNDPQFIIMELMEGGDLLSFLRCCRATSTTPAKLVLPDLVKICLHVAKGCQYLEDMHFVHRDLAARNCLVSTKSPADMIVKIGDFGLARDIYKNDYYRKEGEGLLPVRWMSPESLVDGFFTTQSDIWAFGVLMWEVVTLGQQPYPARTNIEVLHFVRDRGKLERPEKCADEMYSLMSKCWNFHPDGRPSFSNLVKHLEDFQEKCQQMTAAEVAQYSPSFTDASSDTVDSASEEEEEETEEEAVTRGLFTPNSRTVTGGGSVRLTHSGKRRRLNDLLGSSDTPEKLVVDLTKMRGKRTHSLEDSKHSPQYIPSVVSMKDHFPAAGEYDHNGYLEPRGTKGGRYLELMNFAPELLHLRDPQGNPLISGNGSAFLPVHVNHKGYHPANVGYMLLSPQEEAEESHHQRGASSTSDSDVCSMENQRSYSHSPPEHPYHLVSVEETPVKYQIQDDSSSRSPERYLEDYHCHPPPSWSPPAPVMVKLPPQRKFSDQDLYSSTVPYRQHQHPSQDHRYTSVECNNNRSSTDNGNFISGQTHLHDKGINGVFRNTQNNSVQMHGKSRLGYSLSVNLPATVEDNNYKLSSGRDNWISNTDDVFVDNETSHECSTQHGGEIMNYQGHGHHGSRSRGQVYPENSSALVGYEVNQISLV